MAPAWKYVFLGGLAATSIALIATLILAFVFRNRTANLTGATGASVGLKASLTKLVTRASENTKDVALVEFETIGQPAREIATNGKPAVLRFVVPVEQVVRSEDLPASVSFGRGRLIIKRFTEKGFALEEQDTEGDTVRAEIYYADELPNAGIAKADALATKRESPIPPEARTDQYFPPLVPQPQVTDPEEAARYFNSFNPPRPMRDLSDETWIKLGRLFEPRDKGSLTLRFLPDVPDRDAYALILLLYGYLRIYKESEVSAFSLEDDLFHSGCLDCSLPPSVIVQMRSAMSHKAKPKLRVDEIANTPAIGGLISEKLGLARGGFYKLTEAGTGHAAALFDNLVRRA